MKLLLSTCLLVAFALKEIKALNCSNPANVTSDIAVIRANLAKWNETMSRLNNHVSEAEWNWASNITQENENIKIEANAQVAEKVKELWMISACYDCNAANCTEAEKRRLDAYQSIGTAALPMEQFADYSYIQTTMENIYATAKVCPPKQDASSCMALDPELSDLLRESNDYCKLQWAWEGWRNESGRKMRGYYTSYVFLQNEAARINGFSNAKQMWTKPYWRDDASFFEQFEQAWLDVKPLYQELHAYVRQRLMNQKFKDFKAHFPNSRHIPAHLFGNMWAQDWMALYDILVPYPNASQVDITSLLKEKKYDIRRMFDESDRFFQSIGLEPMTDEFWKKSIFTRPEQTEMVCHASAWDFYKKQDFRIKMCTQINHEDFATVHHEMGHIQYFMQYRNQPVEFRDGANPGFHEAIGDLIALSVQTPGHLKSIGVLSNDFVEDEKTSMNTLMAMALEKVAFLPFGYLMDKYRWSIFERKVNFANLNDEWWKLRCNMQGVSPPVARTEEDFDAGAKYHIPASVPYDRYFFSFIAQFQFHRAICQRMNFTKDFHKCDIFNQTKAAATFREALALGSSRPYPEVLKMLTGSTKLDSSAIIDYFAPLFNWLKEENKKAGAKVGWDDGCPTNLAPSPCGDYSKAFASANATTNDTAKKTTLDGGSCGSVNGALGKAVADSALRLAAVVFVLFHVLMK